MNNLATIQKITNVRPCLNSDNLDVVQVLGWQVVTKRGEYKDGDLAIYVVIDTILPEKPEFEFLRNKNFRIKPIRLRGQESAGIIFPLSILPNYVSALGGYEHPTYGAPTDTCAIVEGWDVTDDLGIKHYEKPIPPELAGQAVGNFPGFLIITDEDNLRTYPDAVPELYGRPYYITQKEDGSSGTFFIKDGEFGVCSRRIHLKETESNGFWKMAKKYDIENVLKTAFPNTNIAIQAEICGPGVQKNKMGLVEMELRLFNLFDINSRTYLDYDKLVDFTTKYNIPMVPTITEGNAFGYSLEELIQLSNGQKYSTGGPAEGIVIRPKESFYSPILKKYWSGKVLNELYKED